MKVCTKCKKEKPWSEFSHAKTNSDGYRGACKRCFYFYKTERNFGVTEAHYEAMLLQQNNACAICCRSCPTGRMLAVDHDHSTGKVRGLLCMPCNRALGMFGDNAELLQKAITYLKENTF
jgi:hypothetical protein